MRRLRHWHGIALAFCMLVLAVIVYRDHQVRRGHQAFERLGCPACHGSGGAPSLEHVGRKYDRRALVRFISDPEVIYAQRDHQPLNAGFMPMPRLPASARDIEAISYFLSSQR